MSALSKVQSPKFKGQSFFTKLFLSLFCLFTFSFLYVPPVEAAPGDFKPLDSSNFNDSVNVQRFYRNQLVTLHVMFFGTDPFGGEAYGEKLTAVTENGQTKIASVPGLSSGSTSGGAIGMLGSTVVALYNPPTSSIQYLASLGENMGLSPKVANAQSLPGSGAGVIDPVLKLWQVMRNIAYVAFILVFIAAGLMIMFRQKLNPQTVIGIQQALPGLIIGLIMVTFSYFVAAFIIDLAFVGTRVVAEIFVATGTDNYYKDDVKDASGNTIGRDLSNVYNQSNAFDLYGRAATRVNNVSDVFGSVYQLINAKNVPFDPAHQYTWDDFVKGLVPGAVAGTVMLPLVGTTIGAILGGITSFLGFNPAQAAGGGVVALLSSILIPIILAIALMIQFIKLIIALLMSYLQILIFTIAGPFYILISAVPGRGGVMGMWLKSLLANALVFPAVFAGFLFAGMLLNYNMQGTTMPLFGNMGTDVVKVLLAFGVLLGLPSIPEMVRGAFGVKGPQGFTQAAIGGFMGGVGGLKTGYNQAMEKTGMSDIKLGKQKAEQDDWKNAANDTKRKIAEKLPFWK